MYSHHPTIALSVLLSVAAIACSDDDEPEPRSSIEYVESMETIVSTGEERSYHLVRPTPEALADLAALPLVIAFHGDGGNAVAFHETFPFEHYFQHGVVAVYPSSVEDSFEYWTDAGRAREATLVRELIAALSTQLNIDVHRVFLSGFSGGATLINAVGCRLGANVIRGMGVHSGTLYQSDPHDFEYTANGGVTCALPDTIFAWGAEDDTDVGFEQGSNVRDNYRLSAGCSDNTTRWTVTPCVSYDGCGDSVVWCPIDGMGHSVWSRAPEAFATYFETLN